MSTFPGSFHYDDLFNMDVRDLELWYKEAMKVKLDKHVERINSVRVAMGDAKSYEATIRDLQQARRKLTVGIQVVQKENWDFLKSKFSKKKV